MTRLQVGVAASDMDPIPREAIDARVSVLRGSRGSTSQAFVGAASAAHVIPLAETLSVS
jgi:hypothetical protein